MSKLTIRFKLMLLLGLSALAAAVIFAVGIYSTERIADMGVDLAQSSMLAGEKQKIQVATDTMAHSLAAILTREQDEDGRVRTLREAIRDVRFEADESGYYFVYSGTVNVAHPVKPALQGKDLGELKGSDGVYSVRDLARAAQAGGGFVNFMWDKPGKGQTPKLGYAAPIPGTKYWIGTGVYIDNVDEESARIGALMHGVSNRTMLIDGAVFLGLFLLVLLPLGLVIARGIVLPIRETTAAARRIAEGDLDVRLNPTGSDEASQLQHSLVTMTQSLRETMDHLADKEREAQRRAEEAGRAVQEAQKAEAESSAKSRELLAAAERLEEIAEVVSSASEQMAARIDQSSRGAEVQAQRVAETATAMDEMGATVIEVARNASNASDFADKARARAAEGARAVLDSQQAIESVAAQSRALKDDMGRLGRRADSIGQILGVISDIADQTNLLALNAAIEAARAGDAGRGFAVVADEVRKLAEKTMTATQEVGEAIHGIQADTRSNIESVEASVRTIGEVAEQAGRSGEVLRDIVSMVESTTDQVRAIAAAAEQQSAASEQIGRSVSEINRISAETSEGMHESAEAVNELNGQTQRLKGLIGNLASNA